MIPSESLAGIRLLIFDLDGTLVDSELDLALSVNAVRRAMGLDPLPVATVASYVGQGVTVLIRRALGEAVSKETIDKATEMFLKYYGEHMLDNTVPYDGVREALAGLDARPMAVLTNKPVRFSTRLLAGLDLARQFKCIYGGDSFASKKPDPVGVNKLMNDLGASARTTLIVGDSDTDVFTGRNAGVWTCGVTYGIGSRTLRGAPPDLLLDDLRELPVLLNGEKHASKERK